MKAIWKNTIIAESNNTIVIEGNHYFPIESVKSEFLEPSEMHTTCPWKGEASYYSIHVNGNINSDAAWYYPNPSDKAKSIQNHVAFWKGVQIED